MRSGRTVTPGAGADAVSLAFTGLSTAFGVKPRAPFRRAAMAFLSVRIEPRIAAGLMGWEQWGQTCILALYTQRSAQR